MPEASSPARTTLAAAVLVGVLGDHLVRAPVWGVNVGLFAVALSISALTLAGENDRGAPPWLWSAALFFAGMWAVRDAPMLLAADLLAALGIVSLPLVRVPGRALESAGLLDLVTAPARAARQSATGGAAVISAAGPQGAAGAGARRLKTAVGGLLLAVPLVTVFGFLFAAADPVFGATLHAVFDVDIGLYLSHLTVVGAIGWIAGGYLWGLADSRAASPGVAARALPRLPVLVPLGATALVFAAFVMVQAGTLFGGEAFVQARAGITYAEYARGGFFQMVFASALSLPLVYAAPFFSGPTRRPVLRGLMAAQLVLTALVLASALWRMGLYIRVYGLTEDRLYGTAVMIWIGATLVVLACTVLRGRPDGAAFRSFVAAAAALAVLNLANPKAVIARFNVAHQDRRAADLPHLVRLGGDAVPVLVSRFDLVAAGDRCGVARDLLAQYGTPRGDWRGWNLARSRARRAARSLEEFARDCGPSQAL